MRTNSGFTFTEMVAIIAIIGILACLAIPNFINWLPKYRLQSWAENNSVHLADCEGYNNQRKCDSNRLV